MLARDLLRTALAVLPELDPGAKERAFFALDAFVARPAPAGYLAAIRVLGELRRAARLRKSQMTLGERARARGLAALAAVPEVGAAAAEALELIGADAGTEPRLQALASLLDAHRELAARVRRADDQRRPLVERMRSGVKSSLA